MIAYEDLVVALTNWRIQQGLPTNAVTFMSPSAGVAPSLPLTESPADGQFAEQAAADETPVVAEQAEGDQVYAVDEEAIDEELPMAVATEVRVEVGEEAIDEELPAAQEVATETRDEDLLAANSLEANDVNAAQNSLSYDDETLFGDAPMPGESIIETATDAAAHAPRDPETYDASDLEVSADEMEVEEEVLLSSTPNTEEVSPVDYAAEPTPEEESFADVGNDLSQEESFSDINTSPVETLSGLDDESTLMNDDLDAIAAPVSIEMDADEPERS